ncbi:hypothetical protein [uncultured Hymenobacter sp.]|uniref:hypothetical protein n=1 Tax=uncultured Hymenobacter sp. TaxID=170016 RepID=UPI0035CBB745
MSRSASPSFNYRPLLRRAGILAVVSLVLALLLVLFLFGIEDEFFRRVAGAFFVFFWLLSITFLGVVPFVSWAANRWFSNNFSRTSVPLARKPRTASSSATVRKPVRTVSGHNK